MLCSPTKTERPRDVKVPASALAALRAHRKRQDEFRKKFGPAYRADLDLIFANPDGTALRPNSVSSVVSLLFRRLNLRRARVCTPYATATGRTCWPMVCHCRWCRSARALPVRTTAEVYAHAIRGQDDEAALRWDEFQRRGTGDRVEGKLQ